MNKSKNHAGRKDNVRRSLRENLTIAVRTGLYTEKMPGITQLAHKYSVNPLTVRRALDDLVELGLVEKRPRVGTFVKYKRRIAVLFYNRDIRSENKIPTQSGFGAIFGTVLRGIEDYFGQKGVAVQTHLVSPEQKDVIEKLKQDVDGFIVLTALNIKEKDFEILSDVRWVRAMGGIHTFTPSGHVTYDNDAVGRFAADNLIEQGCKEFIYYGSATNYLFKTRLKMFKSRIEERGNYNFHHIEIDVNTMSPAEIMERSINAFKQLIVPGNSTGLFLSADMYATPVYQVLYSMGIQPIRDLQIVSCDNNSYYLNGLHPQPPSIDIRMFDIGARAAEMVYTPGAKMEKVILMPELSVQSIELEMAVS
jgi:DNA-binding LacI/PurR family transcriptional regulator